MRVPAVRNERGIALLTTLLVVVAVGAIALAAVMMTLNANLVTKNGERLSTLNDVALAGVEEARSRLNTTKSLYPTAGYTTMETNATVKDAGNSTIPGITRSTWLGPSGIASGQYGVIGSIISFARDSFGNKVVRRLEVNQESFSKFAYFSNIEEDTSGTVLSFLNGDQILGPVHSNDTIHIAASGATFKGQVTTAASTISGQANGTFTLPPLKSVARIPMPTVADLNKLDSLANIGGTKFTGSTAGSTGQARTRILFLTDSLNGQVEGFFKVYQGTDENFVSARLPTTNVASAAYLQASANCGDLGTDGTFLSAKDHDSSLAVGSVHRHGINTFSNMNMASRRSLALTAGSTGVSGMPHCYLGGDSILTKKGVPNATYSTTNQPDGGTWVAAPSAIQTAVNGICTRRPADCQYLFPLSRQYNPNFKGVISVQGKVIVSGVVHGRVTVAATGNVIFGSNITYYQGSTRDCTTGDIAGFFSGQSVIISNNTLNAPQTLNTNDSWSTSPTGTFRNYGPVGTTSGSTPSTLTIYGFFLTLRTYGAERYDTGDDALNVCLTDNSGRGCLYTFGGIIQGWRGAVTQGTGGGYTGYKKQYSYDACGATDPPPYYPTTGIFVKNRFYEMDPTHFDVAAWFAANQN
ncbi:MAG TPA: hypothetical protein VJN95_12205 [Gemmatimonadales bacterium]|nr:hypothetical protein [Gemmatimonadales bacterium]